MRFSCMIYSSKTVTSHSAKCTCGNTSSIYSNISFAGHVEDLANSRRPLSTRVAALLAKSEEFAAAV